MKLSNEAFVVVGLGIATLLVLVFAVATQETELPRDEITKIVDEQVPEWARLPDPPTTPDELPSHEQADTEYLGSRAGNLFWENLNLVPDGPGTTSGIGDILMVYGEDDQDYRWRPLTANPDFIDIQRIVNTNRQSVADAEGRIDLEIRNRVASDMDEVTNRSNAVATVTAGYTSAIATVTARVDALDAPGNEYIFVDPPTVSFTTEGLGQQFVIVLQGFTSRSRSGADRYRIIVDGINAGSGSWAASNTADRVLQGQITSAADIGTLIRNLSRHDHVAVSIELRNSSGLVGEPLNFSRALIR